MSQQRRTLTSIPGLALQNQLALQRFQLRRSMFVLPVNGVLRRITGKEAVLATPFPSSSTLALKKLFLPLVLFEFPSRRHVVPTLGVDCIWVFKRDETKVHALERFVKPARAIPPVVKRHILFPERMNFVEPMFAKWGCSEEQRVSKRGGHVAVLGLRERHPHWTIFVSPSLFLESKRARAYAPLISFDQNVTLTKMEECKAYRRAAT